MRERAQGRWSRGGARLLAAAAGALFLVGCGGGAGTGPQAATGSPIKLGVLDDNGTSSAIEGAELRTNTDLAIAQINAAGGIKGHRLEAIYVDPKGDATQSLTMAQSLVQQQGVDVLVGGIFSPECLGIQNLAPRLQVAYLASTGCLSEDFAAKQCNRYSFRVTPAGRQQVFPLSQYIVGAFGKKWALIYSDYAYGQSQANAYTLGLQAAGGELTTKIAIPLNETNVTPYITRIPTDGSVTGVINTQAGADVIRSLQSMQQFGIGKKMPVVGVFGKERWAGSYPDVVNGSVAVTNALSDSPSDNKADLDYHKAFRAQLAREDASFQATLGGPDKAVPGISGYQAYTTITALKMAMISAGFTGKGDTDKLITALENLKAPQGPDFPGGAFTMRKSDHQGAMTSYIAKVDGQREEVLSTLGPDKLPPIGSCQVK
ncbi:MAG TPA: ABC transporter substrate-binding protein [Candidatus Dormibacteraeota bacterium]|nr:ABC transporter substrate-binding protein [Candidatus Dormibacteraeota bacterium]